MRIVQFSTGEFYHVYNRGVDKRKIFLGFSHYRRFYLSIKRLLETGSATERLAKRQGLALNSKVEIHAYCFMPNHYHFLLKQTMEDGISEFMHNLNTSYTMFFNLNQKRKGRLFEYTFKAKPITSEEILLHISRYIHLNPVIAGIVDQTDLWPWSSYLSYVTHKRNDICRNEFILSFFHSENDTQQYSDFVNNHIAYAQLLHDAAELKDEDRIFL